MYDADKPLPIRQLIERTVLGELPGEGLDALCAAVTVQHVAQPMRLFGIGQPADFIWLVVEGQVDILDRQDDGPDGLIGVIGPGRWVSWVGLFMDKPHQQDFTAVQDTILLCVPGATMREILARHPAIYPRLISEIGDRVQVLMQLLGHSIAGDPTRHLAVVLNALASFQLEASAPLSLSASHTRLAQMLGISRQMVGRSLETLEHMGLVRRAYGSIELLDLAGLRDFVSRPPE